MGANNKYEAAMHGAEYTPTTDELRDIWVDYNLNPLPRSQGIPLVETAQADFDRWLASVRAEAKAEAWDEGCAAGLDSGLTVGEHVLGIKPGRIPAPPANPYKDAP